MARRALLVGLGIPALLLAAALFGAFDVPGLGRAVVDRAGTETGVALEASRYRLRLFEGLSLEDVRASGSFGVGRYDVGLDRIVFEHRPLALLAGRFEIRRVLLERPRIVLALRGEAPGRAEAETPRESPVEGQAVPSNGEENRAGAPRTGVPVSSSGAVEVAMTGASFELGEKLTVKGLDVTFSSARYDRGAVSPVHALESSGTARIARVAFEELSLDDVAASIRTEGGRFELSALRFESPAGILEGSLAIDFNVLPFRYRLDLAGDAVELPHVGASRLELRAEGFGPESKNLTGEGTVHLEGTRLPDHPLLRALDASLVGAEYRSHPARFEVRRDLVFVEGLRFDGDSFELALAGTISLAGALDLEVRLRRDGASRLYSVKGTLESPEITRRDGRSAERRSARRGARS